MDNKANNIMIAILDSGVEQEKDDVLLKRYSVDENHNIIEYKKSVHYFEHGNLCYRILRKYCPYNSVVSIQVLDKKGRGVIEKGVTMNYMCQVIFSGK